jgi:hypothetical protein
MIDSFEAFSVLLLILPGILGFFVYNQVSDFKVKDTLPSVSWVIFFLISTQITSIGLFGQSFFPDLGAETQSGAHQKITAYLGDISATPLIVAAGYGALFGFLKNYSVSHRILKTLKFSKRISSRQPWNEVFHQRRGIWVVVRFKDGTALSGWPHYYADDQGGETQQLYLKKAVWYVPVGESKTLVPSAGTQVQQVPAGAVLLPDMSNVVAIELEED